MFVGVMRLSFRIPSARSLKDRRRVVRSFKDRVHSRLRLSVAEVGGLDRHQEAVLGVAVVAKDAARCDELLASAGAMAGSVRDAVLVDRATEIIAFGGDGGGLAAAVEPSFGWEEER
ncbi:MAG: DUF503 domain-containing protein [Deltaproteobacteria bacterium]|nr:DUF503 domain-containing protein [Deltaproteobacteria bacterium]MBW2532084.1 DUF503 domain-containing protein [Deltaproteobacteria bacterium]